MQRSSGILMPISSLPSPYGIGTMGKAAYDFVDFLKSSGQQYWQMLPVGPTSYGDSPYSSFSTYAGNPYFIDLDMLIADGLVSAEEVNSLPWGENPECVDYNTIYDSRFKVLRTAFANGRDRYADEVAAFKTENSGWIENYAMYMSIKAAFDNKCWQEWPDDIRMRSWEALERFRGELGEDIDFWVFTQFLFFRQYNAMKKYANENGIKLIGDIPIYVAMDSADIWSEPWFFQLNEELKPTDVSGCPPDAFTADGQLWGNPLYDYDIMKSDGFGWWIRRIGGAAKLFDVIRIDHFRGFESYWSVPAEEETAKNGRWVKGPGMDLVGVLTSWFHDVEFIAEDLGYITPEVAALLKDSGLPGMKVLEFGFDPREPSNYLPHLINENSVTYVGTHDNAVINGWINEIDKSDSDYAKKYLHITDDEGWCRGMIRSGMMTASKLFVMQMQDILDLPASSRMNRPGTVTGNWQWRMLPGAATPEVAAMVYDYTKTYCRLPILKTEEKAKD